MLRTSVPLVVLFALAVGCKKKADDAGGGKSDAGDQGTLYTIKVREPQKGDKLLVVETLKDTTTTTVAGKGGTETKEEAWEYVETILDMPMGARKPKKASREYKVAKATGDAGTLQILSYAGKTVRIELAGAKYTFTADGRPLPAADAKWLDNEFKRGDKTGKSDLQFFLPAKQVKVNETWTVGRAVMTEWAEQEEVEIDAPASSATGKLTRVYTQEGQQWGTLEMSLSVVVKGLGPDKPPLTGTMSMAVTYDCPIDGSSPASRSTVKTAGDIKGTIPEGPIVIKGGDEQTRTVWVQK